MIVHFMVINKISRVPRALKWQSNAQRLCFVDTPKFSQAWSDADKHTFMQIAALWFDPCWTWSSAIFDQVDLKVMYGVVRVLWDYPLAFALQRTYLLLNSHYADELHCLILIHGNWFCSEDFVVYWKIDASLCDVCEQSSHEAVSWRGRSTVPSMFSAQCFRLLE